MLPLLNEKQRRRMLAAEAKTLRHGGIKKISEIACFAKTTIITGMKEIANQVIDSTEKARRKGGGRKKKEKKYPGLCKEIRNRVDSATRDDPETTLRWCSKSTRKLAADLKKNSYDVSHVVVANILKDFFPYTFLRPSSKPFVYRFIFAIPLFRQV